MLKGFKRRLKNVKATSFERDETVSCPTKFCSMLSRVVGFVAGVPKVGRAMFRPWQLTVRAAKEHKHVPPVTCVQLDAKYVTGVGKEYVVSCTAGTVIVGSVGKEGVVVKSGLAANLAEGGVTKTDSCSLKELMYSSRTE